MVKITKKYRILFGILLGLGVLLLLLGNRMTLEKEKNEIDTTALSDRKVALEAELTAFLNQTPGISDVTVLITLEEDGEVLNTFLSQTQSNLKIKGIAVLCKNGEDPAVQLQLSNLLSTLLDLPTHRIFIYGIG